MKKYLFLVALLFVPMVSFASIDRNLSYGTKGDDVVELQDYLIDQGFLKGVTTGNYFSLTRTAVMKWQKSVGLTPSGYFGPLSREEFNAIAESALETTDEQQDNTVYVEPNFTLEYQKTVEANRKLSAELQAQLDLQDKLNQINNSIKGVVPAPSTTVPTPTPIIASKPIITVDYDKVTVLADSWNPLQRKVTFTINIKSSNDNPLSVEDAKQRLFLTTDAPTNTVHSCPCGALEDRYVLDNAYVRKYTISGLGSLADVPELHPQGILVWDNTTMTYTANASTTPGMYNFVFSFPERSFTKTIPIEVR